MRRTPTPPLSLPPSLHVQHLPEAVLGGYTTLEQARTLLANAMRMRFRLGEFDPPAGQAWLR